MSAIPGPVASVIQAQQQALSSQIGVAVLGKQQDAAQQQGAAIVELLQAAGQISSPSSDPNVGRKLDTHG
ncbi:putative motility protein [Lignipirellula cremea]|uniref:Motility protein n=1 Tax=Lignipirellula cremea TaxID=2528010 RepID=A0A518E356_9BACT|nr:putative motility protein [Lignipirellula cremea]QDU98526.1 hypothetical protein Pla8534_63950 [Lignipirellula cremea]